MGRIIGNFHGPMGRFPQLQGSHSGNLQLLGAGMIRLGQAPAGGKEGDRREQVPHAPVRWENNCHPLIVPVVGLIGSTGVVKFLS